METYNNAPIFRQINILYWLGTKTKTKMDHLHNYERVLIIVLSHSLLNIPKTLKLFKLA